MQPYPLRIVNFLRCSAGGGLTPLNKGIPVAVDLGENAVIDELRAKQLGRLTLS